MSALRVGLCGLDPRDWEIQRTVTVRGVTFVYRRATGWTQTGGKR